MDGDSLFNAGYCLLHGKGVQRNFSLAKELFYIAAHKFGHFDSIHSLGVISYEGHEGARHPRDTLQYLKLSSSMGSYHSWIRRGLDNYLNGLHFKSLMCYLRASYLGYEIASANAAYIIQRKILGNPESITSSLCLVFGQTCSSSNDIPLSLHTQLQGLQSGLYLHSAILGNKDNMVSVAHAYLEGKGVTSDPKEALTWYTRASVFGQPMGSLYLAMMNHFAWRIPQNIPRAIHYYELALSNAQLQPSFRLIANTLLYFARWKSTSVLFKTFAGTLERVVIGYVNN